MATQKNSQDQVLVITVKDTELTAVLPVSQGIVNIDSISHASVNLVNEYLGGFTTLKEHVEKITTDDLTGYYNHVNELLSSFATDASQKKIHLMRKIKDTNNNSHDFCLCFQRVAVSYPTI